MNGATRRGLLIGSTALPLAGRLSADGQAAASRIAAIQDDLGRYVGFGVKQSGARGDNECGDWLAAELDRAGFTVEKFQFSAPWFAPERCEIAVGDSRATLWPQPIVVPTAESGVSGPLVRVAAAGRADASLAGAIALVDLPYGRWSSALAAPIRTPVDVAIAGGAKAVAVTTNGPTGKIIALNADGRAPMFPLPVGLLAPSDAEPFLAAAMRHAPASFVLTGRGGRWPAFNLIGRLVRRNRPWVVVSTPRSGWFTCAASAEVASRHGWSWRGGRLPRCPTSVWRSCAIADTSMKTWAPRNRFVGRRQGPRRRPSGFTLAPISEWSGDIPRAPKECAPDRQGGGS